MKVVKVNEKAIEVELDGGKKFRFVEGDDEMSVYSSPKLMNGVTVQTRRWGENRKAMGLYGVVVLS